MAGDHVTRFARVDFRDDQRIFGIEDEDRLLHLYIIGKTGTGKSTLLENMALQDLERGRGLALIDPYRVGFTIAHQYIHQLEPDIRHAVFGNVGSVISFRVGAEDAPYLVREFHERFTHADFLAQSPDYLKLMIDGMPSAPF